MNTEKLKQFKDDLPEHVTLVAISKTKPISDIEAAYAAGQRIFGENRALELEEKHDALPKDIQWHMVGHLQRNKVKHIAAYVDTIHSADSFRIIEEIDKEAKRYNRKIKILLQIKIAAEDTKYGWDYEEILGVIKDDKFSALNNIIIAGVMGMATFTHDEIQVRAEFQKLNQYFQELKPLFPQEEFNTLSMGMSGDYEIAIEEGSTMIRVGSLLFGNRN